MDPRASTHLLTMALSIAALGPALAGSGHPVQRQLEGRWSGDGVEQFAEHLVAPATAWVRGTRFSFDANTVSVTIPPDTTRRGTYSVTRVNGRDVQLAVERGDGKKDSLHLKLDSEHTVRWILDEDRAVVLKREL